MKRIFLLGLAAVVAGCSTTGTAVSVDPMVPAGGIQYPDDPAEPHLTNLRRLTNAGQNAEAYFSADGERLIFQSTMPGVTECDQQFTMTLDGQNLEMVSTGEGRTTCGYFFDGGERIVYSSTHHVAETCPAEPDYSMGYVWALYDYDIYTATDEGGDLERIFGTPVYDAEATLSPDGETIVFTSARDGDLDIYTMRTDGSDVRRLTDEVGYDGGPFFSPDGTKIVYRAHHPTDPRAVEDYRTLLEEGLIRPSTLDIWVMDADGSNKVRVTDNGAANFGPFFHPSGEKIVFSSNMHDPTGRDFDLYLIGVDGSGLERVTVHPDFDGFPMWSPADPGTFVFASNRGGDVEGETNVYLADWVDDAPPVTLSAPVLGPGDPAPQAHAEAGVSVEAPIDTVSCPAFDPDALSADLADHSGRYLAADALEGRLAGSAGAACAAEYLRYAFRRLGLAPGGEDGTYFQEVPLESVVNPHAPGGTGRNVLGILPGTDRRLADEYLVIGAHFDHLGMGGMNSLAEEPAIHNGADDNASGVAALLAVAERLAVGPRPERPVLFMAFTGEESGLLGSAHWIKNPTVPLENVVAMINMDMVGRLAENGLVVYGTGTAAEWEDLIGPEIERLGVTRYSYVPDGYGASDQTAFYMRDIPVLHLFTNTHSDYHKPSDDWDRIDVAGIHTVSELVASLA
ncbi:MAG: M28 family peptidase, partial [Gemmatimonadetes bacterium]|nr:M28 family peptidase [Gemmatimonadota bacterium]NIQ59442.1 M28 family peptidase [Gemmatimonadota bacterium]NIU79628.1 M28 family peptidase [Gammaproteobacteria bacterium]NIX48209.1 M28 family peptidase [Gemmatimonadota bacterium]NIY12642.1 M28 family peptidase [Gemmatimonadota bacterium]